MLFDDADREHIPGKLSRYHYFHAERDFREYSSLARQVPLLAIPATLRGHQSRTISLRFNPSSGARRNYGKSPTPSIRRAAPGARSLMAQAEWVRPLSPFVPPTMHHLTLLRRSRSSRSSLANSMTMAYVT